MSASASARRIGGTEVCSAQLIEMAKTMPINGQPAIEDDDIRQQIAQFAIEVAAKKYNGLRRLTKRLKGQQPGAEASICKLISTDLSQRMTKFATRLLGEYALLERQSPFAPDGDWMRRILHVEIDDDRGRHLGGAEEHDRRAHPATAQGLSASRTPFARSARPHRLFDPAASSGGRFSGRNPRALAFLGCHSCRQPQVLSQSNALMTPVDKWRVTKPDISTPFDRQLDGGLGMPLMRLRALARTFGFLLTALIFSAIPALAADDPKVSAGDTAWVLTSSALVLLMTAPGLALFYGGNGAAQERARHPDAELHPGRDRLRAMGAVRLQPGFLPGYHALIGGLSWIGLNGVSATQPYPDYAATIPHQAYMIFQCMFAVITPALITGAFAERISFAASWSSASCGRL